MADQNAKTSDPKTDEAKKDEARGAFAPEPLPESSPVADHGAEEHHEEKPFADILKDVEPKQSVTASVKSLIENVALEFQARAAEGEQAVHDLADKMNENADAFADAVLKNTDKNDGAAPTGAQRGLLGEALAPADSKTGEPHNPAAESAVRHGMDVETANKMTAPGTNA